MKQHLELADLDKLTPEGKERLRKWWTPSKGDHIVQDVTRYGKREVDEYLVCQAEKLGPYWTIAIDFEYDTVSKKDCLPLLSIGQLIEFIMEYANNIEIIMDDSDLTWHVRVGDDSYGSPDIEFIDALWDAALEILNER